MSASRSAWFALADDGSGAVAPVNWRGKATIAIFFLSLPGSGLLFLMLGEVYDSKLVTGLAIVAPFFMLVPFMLIIRAHLDNTRTRSDYLKAQSLSEGSTK